MMKSFATLVCVLSGSVAIAAEPLTVCMSPSLLCACPTAGKLQVPTRRQTHRIENPMHEGSPFALVEAIPDRGVVTLSVSQ